MISLETIAHHVADARKISLGELTGHCRQRNISWPRQEAYWISRQVTGASLTRIGEFYGSRDHATIKYGVVGVEKRMQETIRYKLEVLQMLYQVRALTVPQFIRSSQISPTFKTRRSAVPTQIGAAQ